MNPFPTSALIKILDTPSSNVFLLVGLNPIDDSTMNMFISLGFDQLLILNFLLLDLLIELMIGLVETFSNIFNHFFMLLTIFHIGCVS